jgi:hypothetical protein
LRPAATVARRRRRHRGTKFAQTNKQTKLHSQNDDNSIFTKEFSTEQDQIALPTTSNHALENAQKKLSDRIGDRARCACIILSPLRTRTTREEEEEEEEEEADDKEKERAKESGRNSTGRVIHVKHPEISPYPTLPSPPIPPPPTFVKQLFKKKSHMPSHPPLLLARAPFFWFSFIIA